MEITEMTYQPNLGIPHDVAPFEITLSPGERKPIHGWIEVENQSSEDLQLRMRFGLPKGYVLSVKDSTGTLLLEQELSIHHIYQIESMNGVWMMSAS